ncbi:MAG: hypothetical protein AUK55_03910 [Syntrophobacteraceae bacterium CG2_30_61_12]|nr:MAG: hypothetical protein AUK55_03910 [Syntrophobacteraceae bacterium CG2_30_61_12]
MKAAMTAPVLEPVGEGRVALQSVKVHAELENLLCQVTILQVYRNLEAINIEVVYTFPLPLGATLLNLTIKTGARQFKGVVIAKEDAEEHYEKAIVEGDTAIMLEQVDPGLYTVNAGNLQPDDTIEISITYAELLSWRDNSLRFFLPTTIAPRYGDPESLGLQAHQTPEYDLTRENRFGITVWVLGALAAAALQSPSHQIITQRQDGKTVVTLQQGEASMDRDFVLNLLAETGGKTAAQMEADGAGYVALASFHPRFPAGSEPAPRCITIMVDCSGSMGGDSIAQARRACHEILQLLRPEDSFNVVCFGSSYWMLFPGPVPADADALNWAGNYLELLEADMGGTEIGQAITAVINGRTPRREGRDEASKNVLLITDGEVWHWQDLPPMAARSGFRFFTVGVGSCVSEAFLRTLADATGGACELVAPREPMAEKVLRQFKRITFPKAEKVTVLWPSEPLKTFPDRFSTIYDGDTLHVFGRFKDQPAGQVELRAELENGTNFVQTLPIEFRGDPQESAERSGTIARMAAAWEIGKLEDPGEITALGVKYQLMTRFTSYLTVDVKIAGEKAGDLPVLRKTPQMFAAGWGGFGSILNERQVAHKGAIAPPSKRPRFGIRLKPSATEEERNIPSFIGKGGGDGPKQRPETRLEVLVGCLNRLQDSLLEGSQITDISDLVFHGVPEELVQALTELVADGFDEQTIVTVFLYLLTRQQPVKREFKRRTKHILTRAYEKLPVAADQVMEQRIKTAIESNLGNPLG